MPDFRRDYKADYAAFEAAVRAREPFCFVRFNDGELAVLQGKPYKAASGWRLRRKEESWLREPLLQALRARLPGYHVGLSPACCLSKAVIFYRREVQVPDPQVTFSTLFFNYNYAQALKFFRQLDAALVSCKNGDFKVPSDGVNREWDIDALVEQLLEVKKPILLAAGPSACVIGHRYWERVLERQTQDRRFRPQSIIDVGATLDTVVHGGRTRLYHDASNPLRGHLCVWDAGVRRSGMSAPNLQPQGPQPARHPARAHGQVQAGVSPITAKPRELDTAVRASESESPGESRAKIKKHLRRQKGSGAWARRRVRRRG